jgi:hypothetical protein
MMVRCIAVVDVRVHRTVDGGPSENEDDHVAACDLAMVRASVAIPTATASKSADALFHFNAFQRHGEPFESKQRRLRTAPLFRCPSS